MGTASFTSGRVVLGTVNALVTDAVKFNGENYLAANLGTTASSTNAAGAIATGINANTANHGVIATAFNVVEGAATGDSLSMTNTFTIETDGLTETIAIQSSMADLVDQINLQVQSVTASLGENNSLTLSNTTGAQIVIGGNLPT
jgi:flagellin